jgi:Skp family chaperone for outer membrane proteins
MGATFTGGRGMAAGLAAGALLSLGAALGLGAGALAAAPTSMATVDVDAVSQGLQEFQDRAVEIRTLTQARGDEITALQERLTSIQTELQTLADDQQDRRIELLIEGRIAQSDLQTKQQIYTEERALKEASVTESVYSKIMDATRRVAERDGLDVVLFNDASISVEAARGQGLQGMLAAIRERKVLYVREGVDITDAVLTLMNNEYAAGR